MNISDKISDRLKYSICCNAVLKDIEEKDGAYINEKCEKVSWVRYVCSKCNKSFGESDE
jgi:hypothetical protein